MQAYLLNTAVSERVEGASDFRVVGRTANRLLGAFYTDTTATDAMARWILRKSGDRILEPSFGDGAFFRALTREADAKGLSDISPFGAELVHEQYSTALKSGLLPERNAFLGDFLSVEPFEVDAIVGNPPYVRLRHLPPDQMTRALGCAARVLGFDMETSGSIWMPFVLHCMRFLRSGGRMALVLPHELTYVRYARPLWKKLGECFGQLRLVRVHERLFPDILQEVVVLFADDYGKTSETVQFQNMERAAEFAESADAPYSTHRIADITEGNRVFLEALLPERTRSLISRVIESSTTAMSERCVFNIGYVAGDKDFFHPDEAVAHRYRLPKPHLRPAITSGKQIRGCGLRTSNPECVPDQLYLPLRDQAPLRSNEARYIATGEARGVDKRYKCKVRAPWYIVPGVRTPELVLSVFAECPALLINDAGYVASNSLLCGYLKKGTPETFAAAWYTSLTLLQIELQVHSLGGGVMVLVPGEVAKIRMPVCRASAAQVRCVNATLMNSSVEAAYRCGDEYVLRGQIGLTSGEIADIHAGIEILRHWRNSSSVTKQELDVEARLYE